VFLFICIVSIQVIECDFYV